MFKIRSYNKKLGDFVYFENGEYYFKNSKISKEWFDWSNYDLFTMFKDDNGQEIYVGDILSNSFSLNAPNRRSIVILENNDFYVDVVNVNIKQKRRLRDDCGWLSIHDDRYGGVMVIGNIYQDYVGKDNGVYTRTTKD